MQRVRLMTWCPNAVSAMHLPAFAAAEGGLFAEQGLEVELVPATVLGAVGAGGAEFALTGAVHLLQAQTAARGRLPVRFAAMAHQRNAIVGVVREDSGLRVPRDLPAARVARWSMPWFVDEYAGALAYLGLGPPVIVETPGGLNAALGSGHVDVLPVWIEDATRVHLGGMTIPHDGTDIPVRAIALEIPTYSGGLVAADRLPDDVVRAVRDAFSAGYALQRERPEVGLAGFRRHFPETSEEHARANWALHEPYAFDGVEPGSMDAACWERTILHTSAAHGSSVFPGQRVYRAELIAPAP